MSFEVRRVAAGVSPSVLRQEDAVGVICPPRTHLANIVRAEPGHETSLAHGMPDVVNEPAHVPSVGVRG